MPTGHAIRKRNLGNYENLRRQKQQICWVVALKLALCLSALIVPYAPRSEENESQGREFGF